MITEEIYAVPAANPHLTEAGTQAKWMLLSGVRMGVHCTVLGKSKIKIPN